MRCSLAAHGALGALVFSGTCLVAFLRQPAPVLPVAVEAPMRRPCFNYQDYPLLNYNARTNDRKR